MLQRHVLALGLLTSTVCGPSIVLAAEEPKSIAVFVAARDALSGRETVYRSISRLIADGVSGPEIDAISVIAASDDTSCQKTYEYSTDLARRNDVASAFRQRRAVSHEQLLDGSVGFSASYAANQRAVTWVTNGSRKSFNRVSVSNHPVAFTGLEREIGIGNVAAGFRGYLIGDALPIDRVVTSVEGRSLPPDARLSDGSPAVGRQYDTPRGLYRLACRSDDPATLVEIEVVRGYDDQFADTVLWKSLRATARLPLNADGSPDALDQNVYAKQRVIFSQHDRSGPLALPRKMDSEYEQRDTQGHVSVMRVSSELLADRPLPEGFDFTSLDRQIPDGSETAVSESGRIDGLSYRWRDGDYEPYNPPEIEDRLAAVAQSATSRPATNPANPGDAATVRWPWWAAGVALVVALGGLVVYSGRKSRTAAVLLLIGLTSAVGRANVVPPTTVDASVPTFAVPGATAGAAWSNGGQPLCGVYAVYIAARMSDLPVELAAVLKPQFVSSTQGSTLAETVAAAKALGLSATPFYGLTVDGLDGLSLPAVLHVRGRDDTRRLDHYVLLTAIEGDTVTIVNGTAGIERRKLADLAARWEGSGVALAKPGAAARVPSGLRRGGMVLLIVVAGVGLTSFASRAGRGLVTAVVALGCVMATAAAWQPFAADAPLHDRAANAWVEKWFTNAFVPTATLDDVVAADGKDVVVVDARTLEAYAAGHIESAVMIDPYQAVNGTAVVPKRLRAADRVIVYCNNEDCGASNIVAQHLLAAGVKDVSVFPGGWDAYSRRDRR